MLKVIKCPSCAAPLECDGDAFEKCDFCGSQVAVTAHNSFSADSVGFGNLLQQAHQLKEVLRLVRGGNKIEAIKLYREIFRCSLAEAKNAVDRLEHGQSISFQNVQFKNATVVSPEMTKNALKAVGIFSGSMILMTVIIGVIILAVIGGVFWTVFSRINTATRTFSPSTTSPIKSENPKNSFAREILRFGGEGIGAGKFTDNRTIAVDGDGKIYSGDYQGGRVQVFDKDGKFLTQWFVKERDSMIYSLVANRQGKVFVTQPGGKIMAYEGATGKLLNEGKLDFSSTLVMTADGKIVGASKNDILIVDENLKILASYKNASESAGFKDRFNYLGVNGLGEIFATSGSGGDLIKFSASGKFADRFKIKPTAIQDLAIDSKGRIFIAETGKIWVYLPDGNLVDSFETSQTFALVFNDQDELITASRPFVVKYAVKP